MNIALFVPIIDQTGGAEIGTRRLAQRLTRRGHQVTIVSTQPMSQWKQKRSIIDYAKGIRFVRLPVWQRSKHIFAHMLTLEALWAFPLLLHKTQIIHLRGLTPESMMLAKIAHRHGISTLCVPMASGRYGDVATFPTNFRKNIVNLEWISTLTEAMAVETAKWGFPANQIGIIPNGVNIDRFKPASSQSNGQRVIYVGQFRPEKRVDLLLHAWSQVQKAFPNAQLSLVGGGRFSEEYRLLANELNVAPRFVPNCDTPGVIANLHMNSIFVMPGISEGMSNALLEAMGVGLAPIVADTPANRSVITPEYNGLVYQADSPEALTTQIRRLISDADLRQRISAAARKTVVERFNLEDVTDKYIVLYNQILGEKR